MSGSTLPATSRALAAVPDEMRAFVAGTPLESAQSERVTHAAAIVP